MDSEAPGASPKKPSVLFVDDEVDITEIAEHYFTEAGWDVVVAQDISAAKRLLEALPIDVVLSDIMMRGGNGTELFNWLRVNRGRKTPFFMLTGCLDDRVAEARAQGVNEVFFKPCHWPTVIERLRNAVLAPA